MRVRCDLPAAWNGGRGRVINMSAAGLLLAGGGAVEPGAELVTTVSIDGHDVALAVSIRFVGETRLGIGYGARIVGMSDADRRRWQLEYEAHVERAIAQVPPSIGRYLLKRATGR